MLIILLCLENLIQILNILILKRVKEPRLLSIRIFLTKATLKMFKINFCDCDLWTHKIEGLDGETIIRSLYEKELLLSLL